MRRRDFLWYTLAAKVKKEMEKACQWVDPCTSGAPGWSKYRTQCAESVLYSQHKIHFITKGGKEWANCEEVLNRNVSTARYAFGLL